MRRTLAALTGAVLLAACQSAPPAEPDSAASPAADALPSGNDTPSGPAAAVTADDQPAGDLVLVDATVGADAFVVIHRDLDGAPGEVVGHASLEPGTTQGVEVPLTVSVSAGDALWAMLHTDQGEVGTYEFPGPDVPLRDGDDAVVMTPFTVTDP